MIINSFWVEIEEGMLLEPVLDNQLNTIITLPESIGLKMIARTWIYSKNCPDTEISSSVTKILTGIPSTPDHTLKKNFLVPKARQWVFYLFVHKIDTEQYDSGKNKKWTYQTEVYRSFTQGESQWDITSNSQYNTMKIRIPYNKCLQIFDQWNINKTNWDRSKYTIAKVTLKTTECKFNGVQRMTYLTDQQSPDNRFFVLQLMSSQYFRFFIKFNFLSWNDSMMRT